MTQMEERVGQVERSLLNVEEHLVALHLEQDKKNGSISASSRAVTHQIRKPADAIVTGK